ncbi:MAG: head GIN domain-containing protein [Bacteroidia bacterium]
MKHFLTITLFALACISVLFATPLAEGTSKFSGIRLEGSATVKLVPGNGYSVQYGPKTNKKQLQTEIHKGILVVSGSGEITVTFDRNSLNMIQLAGSGDIICKEKITPNNLAISLEGSGDIVLSNVQANTIAVSLVGSGDVNLAGNVSNAAYALEGVGDISAEDLKASNVSASLNGNGDIRLHATEALTTSLTGNGDIHYDGNPQMTQNSKSGEGKIVEL